jgi:hypothetical protein
MTDLERVHQKRKKANNKRRGKGRAGDGSMKHAPGGGRVGTGKDPELRLQQRAHIIRRMAKRNHSAKTIAKRVDLPVEMVRRVMGT